MILFDPSRISANIRKFCFELALLPPKSLQKCRSFGDLVIVFACGARKTTFMNPKEHNFHGEAKVVINH
jgi:hypothetical protein